MALVGELVAGAALGTLFSHLYMRVKEMKDDTTTFKRHLDTLNSTLESLKPLIFEQIAELNVKLGLPNSEIEKLKTKIGEGTDLVERLSQVRSRNLLMKRSYKIQLVELDDSLKNLLKILEVQEARDVKQILLVVKQQRPDIIQIRELLTKLVESLKVSQEPRRAKETLLSVAQSCKQLVGMEEYTRLLLEKPAVKRAARREKATKVLVTNAKMELDPVKTNGVLKGLALLVQRTAVRTIFQELFGAFYKRRSEHSKLDFLQPLIENMKSKYDSKVLDFPKEELENLKMDVEKALGLVRSRFHAWISKEKHKIGTRFLEVVDKSLQKLLEILKVHDLIDANEMTSVTVNSIETMVQRLLDV